MSDDMPRRGRPPKPETERLSEQVWVRLTLEEANQVCQGAIRSRISVSEYLRQQLRISVNGKC